LFLATGISVHGDQIASIALAFAVLERTGSAAALGVVLGVKVVALSAVTVLAGAWADRNSRRNTMLAADMACALAQGASAVVVIAHLPLFPSILLFQATAGAAVGAFRPAVVGLIPTLLPDDALVKGNSLLTTASNVASILGPVVGGALVVGVGSGAALAVDAATFLASFLLVLGVPDRRAMGRSNERFRETLRTGLGEVLARPWLKAMLTFFAFFQFVILSSLLVIGPVRMKQSFGGAAAWSVVMTALGAGTVLGGLAAFRLRSRRPLVVALLSVLTFAPAQAALGVSPWLAPVLALFVVAGVALGVGEVWWTSVLQGNLPRDRISRVSSYDWLVSSGLRPAGLALAGVAATLTGPAVPLVGAAVLLLVMTAAVLAVPSVWEVGFGTGETSA
jgi:MFS family permease